ncbi:hypothetical protein BCR44DRAFT_1271272 [Catenaria anguillulae PL171]|uniref:DUF7029 domain-containing protein n=1 Tax=Catenaria anguillulae PL171 TaxID=765915 RepID=A0A1Y2HZZ3_9FUNG|nr:hypothetical protein BCR44DRAFT_1271272 [Catenaria anguillulae PL171]
MRITLALVLLSVLAASTEGGKKKCHRKGGREIPLDIPADQYAVKPTGPADTHYKLKTGPNGEYMGGSRGPQQVPFNEMHTVPVTRKTYEPRTTVKAAYVAEVPPNATRWQQACVMVADCQFKTKTPTINLDNFAQVKKIACSDEQVTVSFDSDASAAKAAEEWGKAKNLSFIIGREWKCNGGKDETAMRLVKSVAKGTDAKTLIFNAKPGSRNDVIDEFDITVNQYNGGSCPHRVCQQVFA